MVTGLAGKGDSQSSVLMRRFLANIVSNYTDRVTERDIRSKNSAVVLLTADVPANAQPGERITVQISSLGDAKSLAGGVLLQAPLNGADGASYAVAQGGNSLNGRDLQRHGCQNTRRGDYGTGALIHR